MIGIRRALFAVVVGAVGLATPGSAHAQELQLAAAGPRFLSTPDRNEPPSDVSTAPVLQRRVTLEIDRVALGDALQTIARQARLHFAVSREIVPVERPVTVHADGITVGAALFELLTGLGLDVQLSRDASTLSLIPRPGAMLPARRQGTATISGHVIDVALRSSLSDVVVRADGSTLSAASNGEGKYTIAGVAPGTYRVTARRVGYQPLTKDLTVTTDEKATLDFALTAAPTKLDEIVTTAVGEQRRYEVGNAISTINADSIAPTAPITSLTDLISARAPGVTVLETSGMTGSGEAIRIRGLSSLVLQNDPILIVDGIRQDNSAGGNLAATFQGLGGGDAHPTPSRLNDIDFTDIATIDILKGPAASTEYGTDAANGVIVITTKHGTAGPPQWRISAEQTESEIPTTYPNNYYSWGHLADGTNAPIDCPLFPVFGDAASTAGTCVVDSVTQWNPLNHAATSIFGTGNRGKYDLSVSGGSEAVRYFVAGGLTNETGTVRMPPVFREVVDTANVGLPASAFGPNVEQQRSIRVNTAIKLGTTADLSVSASYLSTYQTTPAAGALLYGALAGPGISDAAHFYGYDYFYDFGGGAGDLNPVEALSTVGSQNTDQVTGGLTANWRPTGWFVGHGSVGIDHGSQRGEELDYPQPNPAFAIGTPFFGLSDGTTDVYSVDLRGTATASLARGWRAVTSVGLQMVDARDAGQSAATPDVTLTNLTLNGSPGATIAQVATRNATLGGYGEEQLSVADRLYLTGALRIDAASGFGKAYSTAAYPKASVSWLAIDQTGTTVRLRGAFGENGQQPANGASLQLYAPTGAYIGGTTVTASTVTSFGNPTLRPERSAEFEGGVDIGAWGNRLSVELTGYEKDTHDALVDVNLGATFANLSYQENIGEVRNTGAEITATVGIVQTRAITWDVSVNGSVNHNTLLSLSPGVTAEPPQYASYQQRVGYPLYGLWGKAATYADANRDGIIEGDEVTSAPTRTYLGPSLPTREVSLSTHLGLWRGAVTLSALADYRGGYRITNVAAQLTSYGANGVAANDPSAPLWLQARTAGDVSSGFNSLFYEDGSFVRIREVGVTYAVPRSLARALRIANASVTGAVRNLALWTRYTGADPETNDSNGNDIQSVSTTGGLMTNNNSREDYGAVPLARYWVVRLNVGL